MDRLILTGATLIDGTGAEPVRDRAVVIERGRIGAVLRGRPEGDATELALDGLTLLPGLINCHVHFCLGGEADPARVLFEDPVAIRTIKAVLRTKQTIEAGVTTVRDLGGVDGIALAMRDAVSAGLIPRPRVVATLIAPERIVTHGVSAGVPEFAVRKSEAVIARHLESFQLAMHHGVPIAAGTDAGTPFNPHGSIVPELALMVKAGMSPLEAIRAATSTAARVLGLHEETGRIAPGLAADLIAVAGDPGERIEALDAVRPVVAARVCALVGGGYWGGAGGRGGPGFRWRGGGEKGRGWRFGRRLGGHNRPWGGVSEGGRAPPPS